MLSKIIKKYPFYELSLTHPSLNKLEPEKQNLDLMQTPIYRESFLSQNSR